MIVAPLQPSGDSGRLQMVTQNDHAHFAAELLKYWSRDDLRQHAQRPSLLFAARHHDDGWLEIDASPPCTETGRPHDFLSIPWQTRQEIWQRCTTRHRDRDPYGNLLIVQHALRLHSSRSHASDGSELIADWQAMKSEWLQTTGIAEEQLMDDYRWIDLTDLLSLVVCNLWRDPVERYGYRARLAGTPEDPVLQVDPFPLVGQTTFSIRYREIPDRAYGGVVDLGTTLATARWQTLDVKVTPWTEI